MVSYHIFSRKNVKFDRWTKWRLVNRRWWGNWNVLRFCGRRISPCFTRERECRVSLCWTWRETWSWGPWESFWEAWRKFTGPNPETRAPGWAPTQNITMLRLSTSSSDKSCLVEVYIHKWYHMTIIYNWHLWLHTVSVNEFMNNLIASG